MKETAVTMKKFRLAITEFRLAMTEFRLALKKFCLTMTENGLDVLAIKTSCLRSHLMVKLLP